MSIADSDLLSSITEVLLCIFSKLTIFSMVPESLGSLFSRVGYFSGNLLLSKTWLSTILFDSATKLVVAGRILFITLCTMPSNHL